MKVDGRDIRIATGGARPADLVPRQPASDAPACRGTGRRLILMGAAQPELTRWQLEQSPLGAAQAGRAADVFVDLWFSDLDFGRPGGRRSMSTAVGGEPGALVSRNGGLFLSLQPFTEDFRHAAEGYDFARHLFQAGDPEPV